MLVYNSYPKAGIEHASAAAADYDDRLRGVTVFEEQALFNVRNPSVDVNGVPERIHAMHVTASFFRLARRPKFLLWLLAASHLPPYRGQEPQLDIVERAAISFLDHYLKGRTLGAFERAAQRPGVTRLIADP